MILCMPHLSASKLSAPPKSLPRPNFNTHAPKPPPRPSPMTRAIGTLATPEPQEEEELLEKRFRRTDLER